MTPSFPPGQFVILGGGGAIGSAIASWLRREGAEDLLVADISADAAGQVADRLGVAAAEVDLADPGSIAKLASASGPQLAGVVNAAAIFSPAAFPEISWDDWTQTLGVNLIGAHELFMALLPRLQRGASIVQLSSVEAFHVLSSGGRTATHYAASKGGVEMMVRALASDLGPAGIRVNCVAPGYIETPLNAAVMADPQRRRFIEGRIPLEWRIGEPDDIAGVVCFLLSDAARYVTGATLVADGGLTLGTIGKREDG